MWRSEVTAGIPCVYTRNLKLNLETSLPVTEADKSAQIVRNVQVQAKNKSSDLRKNWTLTKDRSERDMGRERAPPVGSPSIFKDYLCWKNNKDGDF